MPSRRAKRWQLQHLVATLQLGRMPGTDSEAQASPRSPNRLMNSCAYASRAEWQLGDCSAGTCLPHHVVPSCCLQFLSPHVLLLLPTSVPSIALITSPARLLLPMLDRLIRPALAVRGRLTQHAARLFKTLPVGATVGRSGMLQ